MRSARRRMTHRSTRTAFEWLESRAMLAGLGPDSFSGLGSNTAVLLPGGSGTNLFSDSPTSGSIGSSASPTSPSGSSGTQSTYLALPSSSVSGIGSTSAGSSGSSTLGGLALPTSYGPGTGSSSAGTGSDSNPNGPSLSSQSSVVSRAVGQSSVVSAPGTNGATASNYADGTASSAQAAAPSALSSLSGSSAGGWLDRYATWFNNTFGSGYSQAVGGVIYHVLPVSDETLANASDLTLLGGTTIASVPVAVGVVAGGEVLLGVGTLGGAASTSGTATAVATGVTVTEGVAGGTIAVVAAEATAIGSGSVVVMAEAGSVGSIATGATIAASSGPEVIAVGNVIIPTTTIITPTQTVVFGHGARHLAGTSLARADVETAIALAASRLVDSGVTNGSGFYVSVEGVLVEFRLFVVDGIIRLGTYIPR